MKSRKEVTVRSPVSKRPSAIYQLKITLKDIRPPIWRRVQVPGDITLGDLHDIIQSVMGWGESHLHAFVVGDQQFGDPDPELEFNDERKVRLNDVAGEKSKFHYEYDFGDSWIHEIVVEKILPSEPDRGYPVCIKAVRACPPEDCGGPWGYADFLDAIKDPKNPEYEEMLDWIGDDFDPEYVDLEEINKILKQNN